jgi:hypothetical protein
MLEKFKEFKDTLSERIKSPFVGSFIITWSVLHWKIFALFLFEQEDIKIDDRISKIETYLSGKGFCDLFITPALITLGILLLYSLLNAAGLVIKLIYDNWASPGIQSLLYNKNIIEKPKYDRIKRQYAEVKKEHDEDKDRRIKAEQETKESAMHLEAYKKNSFEVTSASDITHALSSNFEWQNVHVYPDGQTDSETFHTDPSGFTLKDGSKIKIQNIKITPNGKILTFDKIIGDKTIPNTLIRDSDFNYHGVELENIKISYCKVLRSTIVIESAKYTSENNYIDVKNVIQKLLDTNTHEFEVSNHLMGGDPGVGKQKHLNVIYSKDGKSASSTVPENGKFKFD